MKDLYKTLGLPETASQETIKKAYRKLAKEYHPDVTGGDKKKTERFKEANEAYAVLGDEKKRKEYDRLRRAPPGADGMPQGFDPETFAQVFGGGRPFRGGRVRVSTEGGEFGDDLGDLFASLFGGGGASPFARARRGPARGQDMSARLEVSFREAALGTRRTIRTVEGTTVEVQIPPGVQTGVRLRLASRGGRSEAGGPPGDLHLEVAVSDDPVLRRAGDDVELDLPLTLAEAILGTRVEVPTVDGNVRLTVPPGTSGGGKLRLKGKGIKRPDGSRGDQICRIQVVVPRLGPEDAEARRLVEDLDKRTRGGPVRPF